MQGGEAAKESGEVMGVETGLRLAVRRGSVLMVGLVCCLGLSGCLVAGVSSNGGAFIWPGGLGLLLMIALVIFLLRGRR